MAPKHVCTTAVLRLLKSGLGLEKYRELLNTVITACPNLSHGYPIVELTHAIAQEIHRRACNQSLNIAIKKM